MRAEHIAIWTLTLDQRDGHGKVAIKGTGHDIESARCDEQLQPFPPFQLHVFRHGLEGDAVGGIGLGAGSDANGQIQPLGKRLLVAGADDLLHFVVEIKGYRGEDAKDKKATMDTYWVPGVNNLGSYGRWAFVEIRDIPRAADEIDAVLDAIRPSVAA